jgi:hypothetical protein
MLTDRPHTNWLIYVICMLLVADMLCMYLTHFASPVGFMTPQPHDTRGYVDTHCFAVSATRQNGVPFTLHGDSDRF